jgi:hypothetical protein
LSLRVEVTGRGGGGKEGFLDCGVRGAKVGGSSGMIKVQIGEHKVGICLEQAAHSFLEVQAMVTSAEEGGHAVQGTVLGPLEAPRAEETQRYTRLRILKYTWYTNAN